ncbi:MAG TPA: shikimate kinase [bacterium]|nr:shikimate kinase [bacterium]HPM59340.1 shikimate kinase [bacterium]
MYPWDGKNIYFMGFMGTGKSKVGRAFARLLGRPFADSDDLIVARAGLPVEQIFKQRGEEEFRVLEDEIVDEISRRSQWVISLGGGAVLRQANWEKLQASGLTICLEASLEVLASRLARKNDRPLVRGLSGEALHNRIQELYSARAQVYARAHYHFQSREEVSAAELAEEIFLYLRDEP